MATNRPGDQSPGSAPMTKQRRIVTSTELLGNCKELIIQHGGEEYRLMITKQSKMILTK